MVSKTQLEKITLTLKANVYFEGGVTSHSLVNAQGQKQSVGIVRAGTYRFTTQGPERMDIIAGTCRAKLFGEAPWTTYKAGEGFDVPGNLGFEMAVDEGLAEYLCTFQ